MVARCMRCNGRSGCFSGTGYSLNTETVGLPFAAGAVTVISTRETMAGPGNEALKTAVALAYGQADAAPRVVAKGRGFLAEQIIARARESGVYVHQSTELVALLLQVDLDQHIPPQLYLAVAELLAWLYRLENGQPVPSVPKLTLPESDAER